MLESTPPRCGGVSTIIACGMDTPLREVIKDPNLIFPGQKIRIPLD